MTRHALLSLLAGHILSHFPLATVATTQVLLTTNSVDPPSPDLCEPLDASLAQVPALITLPVFY